jgi:hypothetical protein
MPTHIEFPVRGKLMVTGMADEKATAMETFRVYPNPANDLVAVSCESNKPYDVQLLNLMGQSLQSGRITNNICTLDVKELPSGVYVIRIAAQDGSQVLNRKLVIQR